RAGKVPRPTRRQGAGDHGVGDPRRRERGAVLGGGRHLHAGVRDHGIALRRRGPGCGGQCDPVGKVENGDSEPDDRAAHPRATVSGAQARGTRVRGPRRRDHRRQRPRLPLAVPPLRHLMRPELRLATIFPDAARAGASLRAAGLTVAVGESCTGGLVGAALTAIAGSSDYMRGGVIAYSDAPKSELLEVSPELIAEFGAVSESVARAMAEGVRARCHADIGVAVTGVAGPGGGTAGKPVGPVFVVV